MYFTLILILCCETFCLFHCNLHMFFKVFINFGDWNDKHEECQQYFIEKFTLFYELLKPETKNK